MLPGLEESDRSDLVIPSLEVNQNLVISKTNNSENLKPTWGSDPLLLGVYFCGCDVPPACVMSLLLVSHCTGVSVLTPPHICSSCSSQCGLSLHP